jgi:hypothetical protein
MRAPFKQGRAAVILQFGDLPADGGGRYVEARGRVLDAACAYDLEEVAVRGAEHVVILKIAIGMLIIDIDCRKSNS